MVSLTSISTLSKDASISTSSEDPLANCYSSAGYSMSSNDLSTNLYSEVMASGARTRRMMCTDSSRGVDA